MEINKQILANNLIFNKCFHYSDNITLYPVKMKDVLDFQKYQQALVLRKDSIFKEKEIIKMEYWDFMKYSFGNFELAEKYNMPALPLYFDFIARLLVMVCDKNSHLTINDRTFDISINGQVITNSIFEDLRKIILLQNDIDFDVDEFMNIDTVKALEKAREFEAKKNKEKADIEDYIDSLIIDLKVTEEYVENMTVRKFWRYIKRINKHEDYQSYRSAAMTGLVTFKEPIQHWMTSIEITDKYANLKADEQELRSKIG